MPLIRLRRRMATHLVEYTRAAGGGLPERPDLAGLTFLPYMCKRPGQGPFAYAPIVQGPADVATEGDKLYAAQGDMLGNPLGRFYSHFDFTQGTVVFWVTPEWDSNDGLDHYLFHANRFAIYKASAGSLALSMNDGLGNWWGVAAAVAWTAGSTHLVAARWDTLRSINGTYYACLTADAADTFDSATPYPFPQEVQNIFVGNGWWGGSPAGNAIIEGLTVFRRVLYDGTYGTAPHNGVDELGALYAAGAGADPAEVVGGGGSWNIPFCLPTNNTFGAIVTGTGEGWSHPSASNLLDETFMDDGDPPGTPYAVELDGSSTYINCGSGVTLDDIPAGGNEITVEMWFRLDADPSSGAALMISKGLVGSGWRVLYEPVPNLFRFTVELATTDAVADTGTYLPDGKWHHLAAYYDDTAKVARIALDGRWGNASVGAAGAYLTDASRSLYMGRWETTPTYYLNGAIAWAQVWSDDHHVAGTDFIHPRAPNTPGGNLVESWHMDEGTGANIAAQVTSPGNDGTIVSGSWSRIWELDGTPVIMPCYRTNASTTDINGGSGASIDNLPAGANGFTAECWICLESGAVGMILGKQWGWIMHQQGGVIRAIVYYDVTDAVMISTVTLTDGSWHHLAITYNENTDRMVRIWIDGRLRGTSNASAGNYIGDAALNFRALWPGWLGAQVQANLGWVRLSDTVRYTATFSPDPRSNPPGIDGNTQLQWDMTQGAGAQATDTSGNANHGTITGGGRWHNTTDMVITAPGERVGPWGYHIGSDGANDGITIIEDAQVTAGTAYVLNAVMSYGMSSRARPLIRVYDNTGAANVVDFYGPRYYGQHTGANNQPTLTDAGARWTQNFTGWTIFNLSDGSSATITAQTETTITGVLAGGTENDWDTNEYYMLRPPGYRTHSRHPWTETVVFTAPAGCTSIDVKVLNAAAEGFAHVHQVEVLPSLLVTGDHEAGAGNPYILANWTNGDLDAGDTAAAAATFHAGAQAVNWTATAAGEYQYRQITLADDKFFTVGMWTRGSGAGATPYPSLVNASWHEAAAAADKTWPTNNLIWTHIGGVARAYAANPTIRMYSGVGGINKWSDDIYAFALDDVSVTATPASQANSAEDGGLRIDGMDQCNDVPTRITAMAGWVRVFVVVRQDLADSFEFHVAHTVFFARLDINNYFHVNLRPDLGATHLELVCVAGGVPATANAALPGGDTWNAGETKLVDVRYTFPNMSLWVDGAYVTGVVMPAPLAGDPVQIWWGMGWGDYQLDGVIY